MTYLIRIPGTEFALSCYVGLGKRRTSLHGDLIRSKQRARRFATEAAAREYLENQKRASASPYVWERAVIIESGDKE